MTLIMRLVITFIMTLVMTIVRMTFSMTLAPRSLLVCAPLAKSLRRSPRKSLRRIYDCC